MPIITISRGAYSRGKAVAEKVAQNLGYDCVAHEVMTAASKEYNLDESVLVKAIQGAPPILNRFVYRNERYLAYLQKVLLHHLQKDNVVYHGPAGHFFVKEISHVLKVRVVTAMEDRIRLVREQQGISRNEAIKLINKLDEQRQKWSREMFGVSAADPGLYDLVINIKTNVIEEAVELICETVQMADFRTSPASQQAMNDLVLAADLKAALVDIKPDVEVSGSDGTVHVTTTVPQSQEEELVHKINEIGRGIRGIKEIKVHTHPSVPYGD